jgi:hypothetical protein
MEHANFITITCLDRKYLLAEESIKDIVIDSLRFLTNANRIKVFKKPSLVFPPFAIVGVCGGVGGCVTNNPLLPIHNFISESLLF